MDHRLIEGLMEAIAPLIKGYIDDRMAKDIAPLLAKIELLEGRQLERGEKGDPGKDADPEEVQRMVEAAVAQIRKPEDGKSVTVDDVKPLLSDMVKAAVSEIELPVPKDGQDGAPGKDAEVDLDALALKAAELIEKPRDGVDGKDAEPLDLEALAMAAALKAVPLIEKPKDGVDGERGPEGVGVKDLLTDADGNLVATLTNGEVKRVGRVVGRDGKDGAPGKDGADGLGFEDMDEFLDEDGRTVVRRYSNGDVVKEFRHTFRVPLDAGIWKEGQRYNKGDGVTYGGSWWIAQKDEPQGRPDSGNKDFRLAVKKGRDGKDGAAPPPPPGPIHVPGAKSGK
jgi:hypothetical protein